MVEGGRDCYLTIRLSQPSLAGVRAGAELGNIYLCVNNAVMYKLCKNIEYLGLS